MEADQKRLAALLAAHKNKEAHDAYLRHQERATLAGRRNGAVQELVKRHPNCKMTADSAMAHLEY